jgi:hypothetical protein
MENRFQGEVSQACTIWIPRPISYERKVRLDTACSWHNSLEWYCHLVSTFALLLQPIVLLLQ